MDVSRKDCDFDHGVSGRAALAALSSQRRNPERWLRLILGLVGLDTQTAPYGDECEDYEDRTKSNRENVWPRHCVAPDYLVDTLARYPAGNIPSTLFSRLNDRLGLFQALRGRADHLAKPQPASVAGLKLSFERREVRI
jgi:hypothetical protein